MGCTLGRITGLESPRTIRQEGDKLRLTGEFAPTSVAEGVALAQQVIGYPSPDEEVVPFTYDATGAGGVLDGFYFVVSTQVDWAKLASGLFSWEAELMAVPGKRAPLFEVSCIGARRSNVHGITTERGWFAVPASARDVSASTTLGVTGSNMATVPGFTSDVAFIDDGGGSSFYDVTMAYRVAAASFYSGSVKVEVTDDAGATWRPVIGRDFPGDPDSWRLSSDLIRIAADGTNGRFTVALWDDAAGAWRSKTYKLTRSSGAAEVSGFGSIAVARNRPEVCTIIVGGNTGSAGDAGDTAYTCSFTVRRGAWWVECDYRNGLFGGTTDNLGVARATTEAGTGITGGIGAASDDADGHRYRIWSPIAVTADTTAGGLYASSAVQSIAFGISTDIHDAVTNIHDVDSYYFAAMEHYQQVVAR